jgi:hypothetical protein
MREERKEQMELRRQLSVQVRSRSFAEQTPGNAQPRPTAAQLNAAASSTAPTAIATAANNNAASPFGDIEMGDLGNLNLDLDLNFDWDLGLHTEDDAAGTTSNTGKSDGMNFKFDFESTPPTTGLNPKPATEPRTGSPVHNGASANSADKKGNSGSGLLFFESPPESPAAVNGKRASSPATEAIPPPPPPLGFPQRKSSPSFANAKSTSPPPPQQPATNGSQPKKKPMQLEELDSLL